jgi:hypothetical protein
MWRGAAQLAVSKSSLFLLTQTNDDEGGFLHIFQYAAIAPAK